jgi:putative ABC transport system permease protein
LANSWSGWGVRLRQEQRYDVEIALSDSDRISDVAAAISELPEVAAVETWGHLPTSFITKGKFPVSRTYPDDAHGSFTLLGPAPRSSMLELKLTEGRWLNDSDTDALVINQIVPGYASLHVGATVTLALEGVAKEFRVVGKVEQVGVGATAYAQLTTLNQQLSSNNLPGLLRVRGIPGAQGLSAAIEQALHQSNAKVVATTPLGVYENAMVAHFEILIKSLLALAALTALVGAIGLSSSLLISVLERIREFGVLAAVGANRRQIRSVVLLEGTLVGLVSLGITFTIGPLIALGLGAVIGQMSFALPLPFAPNYAAMATWAGAVLTLSAIASALPALRASNLSVREAMDHV